MSTPTARCPICYTHQPAPVESDQLICPGCEHPFIPEGLKAKPAERKPVGPRRATVPRSSEGGSRRRDDEDDRPPTRTRRKYDDEDDRPAKKGTGSGLPLLLIGGGALAFLVLGGVAAVAVALLAGGPVAQATFASSASEPLLKDKPQGNWEDQKRLPGARPAEPPKVEPWQEPAPPPKPVNPPVNDLDAIAGTWKIAGFEVDGRPVLLPPEQTEGSMTFTRDGIVRSTGKVKGEKRESRFTLDPAAAPKAIDIHGDNPPGQGKATLGVYELAGDTLRLCFGLADGARPTALKGPGVLTSVCVLKRVKESNPARPVAPPADKGDLVGTWKKREIIDGGNVLQPGNGLGRYTFGRDGTTRVTGGPAGETKSKYTIDDAASPMTIDLIMPGLTGRFESVPGLFEFDGDKLRLCFTQPGPGAVRPKAFPGPRENTKLVVYILERVKEGNDPPAEKKPAVRGVRPVPFEQGWADFVKASGLPAATFDGPSATVHLSASNVDRGVYVFGGGGRFLVLRTLDQRGRGETRLDVIDVSAGKLAYTIDLTKAKFGGGETRTVAAADRTRLFVAVPKEGSKTEYTLTRYALATGREEKSATVKLDEPSPAFDALPLFAAGSDATDTPLLVFHGLVTAIDPDTLEVKPGVLPPPADPKGWHARGGLMSADGRRVVARGSAAGVENPRFLVATWTVGGYEWAPPGERKPGPPGRDYRPGANGWVFTGREAYTPTGVELKVTGLGQDMDCWPAVNGGGMVTFSQPRLSDYNRLEGRIQFSPNQPPVGSAVITGERAVSEIGGVVEPLGVIVTWQHRGTDLVIHKFDLPKLLAAHTGDEPLLTLAPPAAERGKTFTCTPLVWSKGKDTELSLTAGPPGMTVTAEGRLEWAVPKGFAESFVTVTLTASSPNGKSTTLTVYPAVVGRRN